LTQYPSAVCGRSIQYKLAQLGRLLSSLISDLPKAHYSPRNWLFSRSSRPLRTCSCQLLVEWRKQNARLLVCPRSRRIGSLRRQLRRSDLDLPAEDDLLSFDFDFNLTQPAFLLSQRHSTSPIVGSSSLAVDVNVAAAYTFSNNQQSLFSPHTRYDYSTFMRPRPSS
jgi:hypothetical protein